MAVLKGPWQVLVRTVASYRAYNNSAGSSARERVRKHNSWVTKRSRNMSAAFSEIVTERAAVRQHLGEMNKQEIHGDPLGRKGPQVARITFENVNGLSPWNDERAKPYRTARFMRRTCTDAYFGAEGNTNWSKLDHDRQFHNLFSNTSGVRTITANNIHENSGKYQPGGTFGVAVDHFATHVSQTGKDTTGLGRWCWMTVTGYDNHTTRIVSAYQPCTAKVEQTRATYNQQRAYFR